MKRWVAILQFIRYVSSPSHRILDKLSDSRGGHNSRRERRHTRGRGCKSQSSSTDTPSSSTNLPPEWYCTKSLGTQGPVAGCSPGHSHNNIQGTPLVMGVQPPPPSYSHPPQSTQWDENILPLVKDWINKGAVVQVPPHSCHLSRILRVLNQMGPSDWFWTWEYSTSTSGPTDLRWQITQLQPNLY